MTNHMYNYLSVCKQMTLLALRSNTWNHLTVCKQMSKQMSTNYAFTNHNIKYRYV